MERYKSLEAYIDGKKVGTLATYRDHLVAFEYADSWIKEGYAISPRSLPLQKKVYIPKIVPFDGAFGVFTDSLPDGWGRLLVDRMLLREHINPHEIDILNRLAIVGETGMGALTYRPVHKIQSKKAQIEIEYDRLAAECRHILGTEYSNDLDTLFVLSGSSGGARPKILTKIDGEDWIVKFPASLDDPNIGLAEYQYSLCAKKCGIEMAETRLLPSRQCEGYFGTKRFDRVALNGHVKRIHMLSVSAILKVSHRIPSLDYNTLMALTLELTKDYSEVEKMYRLMCFNVFAHNRDDHSKNFTFLYDTEKGGWRLAPAYDLTYSNSIGGEHATCINGNGKDPALADILIVANKIGISKSKAKRIAEQVQDTVNDELGKTGILHNMRYTYFR